jgi:hypothetical protein
VADAAELTSVSHVSGAQHDNTILESIQVNVQKTAMEVLVQHLRSVLHVNPGIGELKDAKCGACENYFGLEVNTQNSWRRIP